MVLVMIGNRITITKIVQSNYLSNSQVSYSFIFFFLSSSLTQTRSFHLGPRLESSMKADASLQPGT